MLAAATQSAVAAPVPQLQPPLDAIWNRLSGGQSWPTQFNWPPAYGAPPLLDGTCTPLQKAALQLAQDAACNNSLASGSCDTANQSCGLMVDKLRAKEACIAARLDVMNICYLGGDSGHWQQIEQKMKEINKCINCISANIAVGGQCAAP